MFNHIKVNVLARGIFIISILVTPAISDAEAHANLPPKLIQTTYEVTKNGQPFAKVKEQFSVTGNTYKIESVTKGSGVYALFGERKLTSSGDVTVEGLKPSHFELLQGDNPKKALISDFDWPKKTLHLQVKGSVKEVALTAGTQDLASYAYQFMFKPEQLKDSTTVSLTTGKKLNLYQYKINAEHETIESGGIQYQTLHLLPAVVEGSKMQEGSKAVSETKELWLSPEHYYLPVRIMLMDENGNKLEQTLTDLHIQ